MSIESVLPFNHLILCWPLLLPSVFPSIRVFSNESALRIRWTKNWSFSFSVNNNEPDMLLAAGIPCGYDTRGRKCHGWSPLRITMFTSHFIPFSSSSGGSSDSHWSLFPFYPHKSMQLSVFVLNHSIMHEKRLVIPMEKLLRNLLGLLIPKFLGNMFLVW